MLVTVKEWLESVLNYRSYPKNKTGYPFFGPLCILRHVRRMRSILNTLNTRNVLLLVIKFVHLTQQSAVILWHAYMFRVGIAPIPMRRFQRS